MIRLLTNVGKLDEKSIEDFVKNFASYNTLAGIDSIYPKDCNDLFKRGHRVSSMYRVLPDKIVGKFFDVFCQMTDTSGWTVLLRRIDGGTSFKRVWNDYAHGFGNPFGEFWSGNEFMHLLSSNVKCRLRIDLWDFEGNYKYAVYDEFRIESAENNYRLRIGRYSGNAGNCMSLHDGMMFSTEDNDNDHSERNLAHILEGGWWFKDSFSSFLTGYYYTSGYYNPKDKETDGIIWYTFKEEAGERYSLKRVEMKVQPINYV